ncbi:MAG: aldo/keto reductase [Chloroflexota bacterium]|nr:aldo/keto reductase [Chloroflexota bacterium]MDE2970322.1 aldo/keto reductase [Chloroflexota bacterium]
METVALGSTGIQVSRLGIGLSEIGSTPMEAAAVESLLNGALDIGVNFLDTAACYGNSEELVGKTVAHRRSEYALASKCGHVAGGYQGEAWTAQTVTDSIDRSLRLLQTDYVDLMQLHSCSVEILEQGDVIDALLKARDAGKTRFVGYSGDNEAAMWAVASGIFQTLQTSFSLVDQKARDGLFAAAEAQGMGVIIKRPIGNGVWGRAQASSPYAQQYHDRFRAMAAGGRLEGEDDPIRMAMGFTFAHAEVDTAIVGTTNLRHLQSNAAMLDEGITVAEATMDALVQRFSDLGEEWRQLT